MVKQKSRYVGFRAKITVFEHFDVSGPSTVRAIAHVEAYSNSPDQGLSIGVFLSKTVKMRANGARLKILPRNSFVAKPIFVPKSRYFSNSFRRYVSPTLDPKFNFETIATSLNV